MFKFRKINRTEVKENRDEQKRLVQSEFAASLLLAVLISNTSLTEMNVI